MIIIRTNVFYLKLSSVQLNYLMALVTAILLLFR